MVLPALVAAIMVCTEEICNRELKNGLGGAWSKHVFRIQSRFPLLPRQSNHDIVLCDGSLFMLFLLKRRESIGRERLTTLSHRALMSRGPTNLRLRAKCGQGHGQ